MAIRHKHYHEHDDSSELPSLGIIDFFLTTWTRRVLCLVLVFGATWVFFHTNTYSFLWWLSVGVYLVTVVPAMVMVFHVAFIVLIITCVLGFIAYFIAHPW
jgi:hypothetical protein